MDFVEENVSSRIPWKKRKIYEIIEPMTKRDHLVIPEFSCIGRSMLEIVEILSIVTQKEINVYIIKRARKVDHPIESKVLSIAFTFAKKR